MQFLEIYLEYTQQTKHISTSNLHLNSSASKKQINLVPKEDFLKISSKFDPVSLSKNYHNTMTIDDILKQTKDINLILDKMDETKQKQMEEELKKIEVLNFKNYKQK